VYFTGTTLGDYDVYFLKDVDGIDTYKTSNRGQNSTYQPGDIKDGKKEPDLLTVEVPNIPAGEYFVVLANKVERGDPAEQVTREWIHSEKFTVIQGQEAPPSMLCSQTRGRTLNKGCHKGRYLEA